MVYIGSGFVACVAAGLTVRRAVRMARGRSGLLAVAAWALATVLVVLLWYRSLDALNCMYFFRCFLP